MNKIEEKYEALCRYIDSYDMENLKVLSFPKEDSVFIKVACEKQISKIPINIKNIKFQGSIKNKFKSGCCPYCDSYVDTDDNVNFCGKCGQSLKWNYK